jgi:hypothetical protein
MWVHIPDTFQVHRPDLYNMPGLLALQNPISSPSCHPSDIQQFGAVDEVVICPKISVGK